ncbi:hypothetical protein ACTXT7_012063, partial [Hymenolepis weldensis]
LIEELKNVYENPENEIYLEIWDVIPIQVNGISKAVHHEAGNFGHEYHRDVFDIY